MGRSLWSKVTGWMERVFVLHGKVVLRETLIKKDPATGCCTVLELLRTDKGQFYLHANVQESHTYHPCTEADLKEAAETILRVIETRS